MEVRYFIYNSTYEIDKSYLFLTDHSLNFFSKETAEESPELLKIFQFIAEKASNGRINPESLEQFLTDPRTLRRRIKLHNQKMQNFLVRYLPIIAENGELSVTWDHKHVGNLQGDVEKKVLGIEVIMSYKVGRTHEKRGILLEYIPTNNAKDVATKDFIIAFLKDWELYGKLNMMI